MNWGTERGWGNGTNNRNFPSVQNPQSNNRNRGDAAPTPSRWRLGADCAH